MDDVTMAPKVSMIAVVELNSPGLTGILNLVIQFSVNEYTKNEP